MVSNGSNAKFSYFEGINIYRWPSCLGSSLSCGFKNELNTYSFLGFE